MNLEEYVLRNIIYFCRVSILKRKFLSGGEVPQTKCGIITCREQPWD